MVERKHVHNKFSLHFQNYKDPIKDCKNSVGKLLLKKNYTLDTNK